MNYDSFKQIYLSEQAVKAEKAKKAPVYAVHIASDEGELSGWSAGATKTFATKEEAEKYKEEIEKAGEFEGDKVKSVKVKIEELNESLQMLAEAKRGSTKYIKKQGDKWRIISAKTGKLWPQKYDSREKALNALEAYHANK